MDKKELQLMKVENYIEREIEIHKKLRHPNIAQLYDVYENDDTIHIMMEWCEKGSLENSDPHYTIPETTAKKYFKQAAQALNYLHENRIMHRDIRPGNMCLDKDKNLKLIDFGLADNFDPNKAKASIFCGCKPYAAPEMIKEEPYIGPEIDIWSLGVCLFEMVTGYIPFQSSKCTVLRKFSIPLKEEKLSSDCKDIIEWMLQLDPKKRPTAKDLLRHSWLREK